jgi:hypothetical protein
VGWPRRAAHRPQPLCSPPSDGYLSSTRTDRSAIEGSGSTNVHCACSCSGYGQSSRSRCSTCVRSSRRPDVAMTPAMPRRCRSGPAASLDHSSFTTTGGSGNAMKTGRSTRERRMSSLLARTAASSAAATSEGKQSLRPRHHHLERRLGDACLARPTARTRCGLRGRGQHERVLHARSTRRSRQADRIELGA